MKKPLPPAWSRHLNVRPASIAKRERPPQSADTLLDRAATCREQGKVREAERLVLEVLKANPRNAKALFLAGTLAFDDDQPGLALQYLRQATRGRPDDPYIHLALASTWERAGEPERARNHYGRALALKPDLVGAHCGLGALYINSGDPERGLRSLEKALAIDPHSKSAAVVYADALVSLGRIQEARPYLADAIAGRRHMAHAYNIFASTQTFSSEPPELKSILAELAKPELAPVAAIQLHHAAGKIMNDIKRFDEAIEQFQKAKVLAGQGFNLDAYGKWVDQMISLFSLELLSAKTGLGDPSEVPVFIVGMPRSGTTLIEQICASHPSVHGAGELPNLWRIAQSAGLSRASVAAFRDSIEAMDANGARKMAGEYLAYVGNLSPDSLRIVDKMPHNFQLVGLIALLFPNARIVHCRRDPIDTCLSCFTTSFSEAHGYNTSMQKLGLFYREYDRLMRHWKTVLPARVHECRYESLVADQEMESRRLIDYLGLPWDDACLRFHEQHRPVVTASRWQVRQPIYASSVKRWKNYGAKIQPLIDALGDLAES